MDEEEVTALDILLLLHICVGDDSMPPKLHGCLPMGSTDCMHETTREYARELDCDNEDGTTSCLPPPVEIPPYDDDALVPEESQLVVKTYDAREPFGLDLVDEVLSWKETDRFQMSHSMGTSDFTLPLSLWYNPNMNFMPSLGFAANYAFIGLGHNLMFGNSQVPLVAIPRFQQPHLPLVVPSLLPQFFPVPFPEPAPPPGIEVPDDLEHCDVELEELEFGSLKTPRNSFQLFLRCQDRIKWTHKFPPNISVNALWKSLSPETKLEFKNRAKRLRDQKATFDDRDCMRVTSDAELERFQQHLGAVFANRTFLEVLQDGEESSSDTTSTLSDIEVSIRQLNEISRVPLV